MVESSVERDETQKPNNGPNTIPEKTSNGVAGIKNRGLII